MVFVETIFLVFIVGTLLVAGAINGIAGFGFAVLGTVALASILDPAMAVVFMIIPILAVNISLLTELSPTDIRSCGIRFGPLILGALLGTILGLLLLGVIPADLLRITLGVISLLFVLSIQNVLTIQLFAGRLSNDVVESNPIMFGLGGLFGFVFGGTNVGVQFIAYLKSRELSHGLFIGVVAFVFLGLNGIRIIAASVISLYPDLNTVIISFLAVVPAVIGVYIGKRLRHRVTPDIRRRMVMGLLVLIGLRLILDGAGIG